MGVDEHERGSAPDGPPAAGEHRRARGVLDGETGDDVAEEHIGKEAEAVDTPTVGVEEDAEVTVDRDGRVGKHVVDVGEHAAKECFLLWVHASAERVAVQGEWRCKVGHGPVHRRHRTGKR